LLGPNGAGKTTVMNIMSASVLPDSGTVTIDGISASEQSRKLRKKIGVVFQKGMLDSGLSPEENLSVRGSFYGIRGRKLRSRIEEIAELTGIESFMRKPYGNLSGGQQRRCDIARALLHEPSVLLLDEPASGLDTEIRHMIWDTVETLRRRTSMTVFLTTHYMEEAVMAEKIIIMNRGRIAAEGDPYSLQNKYGGEHLILVTSYKNRLETVLRRLDKSYVMESSGSMYIFRIELYSAMDALPVLNACEGMISDFEVIKGTIDDVYLAVMERGDRND